MKEIYFVRHAKSSWDYPELTDSQRPLNKRGKRDAPKMASFIADKVDTPDVFISSPALRALSTAKSFSKEFNDKAIKQDERLYHASELNWLAVIEELEEGYSSAMFFGHNPGLTDIVNDLSNSNIFNIPTCGVAAIAFNIDSWEGIRNAIGKLKFYHFPKGI